jgi:hypothetical protein
MTTRTAAMARACVAWILACAVLSGAAVAQNTPPVGNKYAALFAINKNGGKSLAAAIATAAAANPAEAQLIVDMAMAGSPEQQAAAAAGLAQAAVIATNAGNAEAAAAIAAAVEAAGGSMATAYAAATSGTDSDNGPRVTQVSNTSSTTTTTNAPVSPAKPKS